MRANKTEQGRSMVEMLGVLAVVGVLSIGALGAYSYGMNKYRTNELLEGASRRAYTVASQVMLGRNPSLAEFEKDNKTAGGEFQPTVNMAIAKEFGIQVNNVNKAVCENLVKMATESTVISAIAKAGAPDTAITESDCADSNNLLMMYHENMGNESDEGCPGGYTGENCDEKIECENGGVWTPSGCECATGWYGETCDSNCPSGYIMDQMNERCRSCSSSDSFYATSEDCAKCGGLREIHDYDDSCALANCPTDHFKGQYGSCISCSEEGVIQATSEGCAMCDDTAYPREINHYGCVRTTCPSGKFPDADGFCRSCFDTSILEATKGNCDLCPNRRYSEGYCWPN